MRVMLFGGVVSFSMDPQLSAAAIALLFGAAKIGLIGTAGFAIAWARARARIRKLEAAAERTAIISPDERLAHLEASIDRIAGQLDQLTDMQDQLHRRLPPPS